MKIAVASGKGGTGKTSLSVALALSADGPVKLLDCDVEEPNCHIFIEIGEEQKTDVFVPVPEIDNSKCDNCGRCAEFCQFNAIASLGTRTLVFPELCHSCGGCMKVCPKGAISEKDRLIGTIRSGRRGNLFFASGMLEIGHPMSPPLIKEVLKLAGSGELVIVDSPPGTSCPMVAAVSGADFVVLVTEPTPFGLHDLKIAVETVRGIRKPHCVVVNRCDSGDDRVERYCAEQGIEIVLKIPDDRKVAVAYSEGKTLLDAMPHMRGDMRKILCAISGKIKTDVRT
ncbi:MAG TPA: ATP-binding protein [Victivallales bacterium]|nr:ATP-binding protein [Victivallales bacterium]